MLYASRFDNESGESLKGFFEKNLDATQEGDIPLDGLYERNKVYSKPGEEIGFDLDTFLNLYRCTSPFSPVYLLVSNLLDNHQISGSSLRNRAYKR